MLKKVDPVNTELEAFCQQFEQGYLLLNPYTAYVARPGVAASNWANDYLFPDMNSELAVGGVAPDSEPPFFVILDQTCDIYKASVPFIHVSPVFNGAKHYSAKGIQRIRDRRVGYLYALSALALEELLTESQRAEQVKVQNPDDWAWVVDLRIQIPLDKGVLLDRDRIPGFASRKDQLEFGRELGNRADRPALPLVVSDYLIPALTRAVQDAEGVLGGVQFRVAADGIMNPTGLELVLITRAGGVSADAVRELVTPVAESIERDSGVPCSVRACGTDNEVTAADFRDSDLLEIELAPED